MEKEEFIKRLKENKISDNPEELFEYRFPVLQYFMSNYTNVMLDINGRKLTSNLCTIIKDEKEFTLVNQAFESLLKNPIIVTLLKEHG